MDKKMEKWMANATPKHATRRPSLLLQITLRATLFEVSEFIHMSFVVQLKLSTSSYSIYV